MKTNILKHVGWLKIAILCCVSSISSAYAADENYDPILPFCSSSSMSSISTDRKEMVGVGQPRKRARRAINNLETLPKALLSLIAQFLSEERSALLAADPSRPCKDSEACNDFTHFLLICCRTNACSGLARKSRMFFTVDEGKFTTFPDIMRKLKDGFSNLQYLALVGIDSLNDGDLANVHLLSKLKTIALDDLPEITDTGFAHIGHLQGLERVWLRTLPKLTDKIANDLVKLPELRKLSLDTLNFADPAGFMRQLSAISLKFLDICDTPIANHGLNHIIGMRTLCGLKLDFAESDCVIEDFSPISAMNLEILCLTEASLQQKKFVPTHIMESLRYFYWRGYMSSEMLNKLLDMMPKVSHIEVVGPNMESDPVTKEDMGRVIRSNIKLTVADGFELWGREDLSERWERVGQGEYPDEEFGNLVAEAGRIEVPDFTTSGRWED